MPSFATQTVDNFQLSKVTWLLLHGARGQSTKEQINDILWISALSRNRHPIRGAGWHAFPGVMPFAAAPAVLVAATTFAMPFRSFAGDIRWQSRATIRLLYFTDGKPTVGVPAFEYEWDEHVWRFSSAKHLELFKADPARYAPQFGNYCAMALSMGQIVTADPKNWLISDGKLYVFGKPAPAGPVLFQRDLAGTLLRRTTTARSFKSNNSQ